MKNFLKKNKSLFLILIFFFIFELISFKILNNYYQKNFDHITLKYIKDFKLFASKDVFDEPIELSTYYTFRWKDNLNFKNYPETIYKGLIDEKFNQKDHPPITESDHYDIFFFGGSTAFLENGKTSLGKYINKFLDQNEKCNSFNFRVITAGHSGYGTINQLNRMVADIINLKPEMIIFFDGINDVIHAHNYLDWEFNDTGHQRNMRMFYQAKKFGNIDFFNIFDPNRYYTLTLFQKAVKKFFGFRIFYTAYEREVIFQMKQRIKTIDENKFNKISIDNYLQNHRILEILGEEYDFKNIHILQPTLMFDILQKHKNYEKVDLISLFPDTFKVLQEEDKAKLINFQNNNVDLFYNGVKDSFYKKENFKNSLYLDYSSIFENLEIDKIYYDYVHYNDEYSINIISKKISLDILDMLNCN